MTEPTFTEFGVALPFSTPAAFLIKIAAGVVFIIKLKVLSLNTDIITGTLMPF